MIKANPSLEHIEPSLGNSFRLMKFEAGTTENSMPRWHFHPELEIAYIKEGSGKRHIGNHISQYYNGDLIMVGSNLPHFGFTDRFSGTKTEIIMQFRADFLGEDFMKKVEMINIARLFERAKSGLSFTGNTKSEIGERFESMFYMNSFEKLLEVMNILNIMANTREVDVLNAQGVILESSTSTASKMDDIFGHVRSHFQDEITINQMSKITNMAEPSFCRFFKKNTGKTFIEFLNEFRITHACKLLAESDLPITEICYESGFNNFSHFNSSFKKITGKNPSEYRKLLGQMVVHEI